MATAPRNVPVVVTADCAFATPLDRKPAQAISEQRGYSFKDVRTQYSLQGLTNCVEVNRTIRSSVLVRANGRVEQSRIFLAMTLSTSRYCWFRKSEKLGRIRVTDYVPGWRNGRRCGLKIRCPKGRAGSTPALGTISFPTVFTTFINLALGMISTPKVKMGLRW